MYNESKTQRPYILLIEKEQQFLNLNLPCSTLSKRDGINQSPFLLHVSPSNLSFPFYNITNIK